MERIYEVDEGVRPYDYFRKIMGGKWKAFLIRGIRLEGSIRFNKARYILGVSAKVLREQLRELEEDGIIQRIEYPEIPPRVEYVFTEMGEKLVPIYDMIFEWTVEKMEQDNIKIAPYSHFFHGGEIPEEEFTRKKAHPKKIGPGSGL